MKAYYIAFYKSSEFCSMPKNSQISLIDEQRFKLNTILLKCEMIKQNTGIDVYNTFDIYLADDERIICKEGGFDEKCCLSCKYDDNINKILQCSKSRKGEMYCGMHKKPADECRLQGIIIPMNIIKTIKNKLGTNKEFIPKKVNDEDNNSLNKKNKPIISKNYRSITISGELFYIKQKTLEAYNVNMQKVGIYLYDDETNDHAIVEENN